MKHTDDVQTGKFISLALRHHPEAAGVTLDEKGYADVQELICGVARKFSGFTMDDLERIAANNNKQRYSFNEDKTKIRANQGHSVSGVDLGLPEREPPAVLFHGTYSGAVGAIRSDGIKKMSRQHVHLSSDEDTAVKVGKRHGQPVVIKIDAAAMYGDGYKFYISENGVWLTEHVPSKYFLNQI